MKKIKEISKKITDIQAGIILLLIYFILVPLFRIPVRPKKTNTKKKSRWFKWQIKSNSLEDMRRQY